MKDWENAMDNQSTNRKVKLTYKLSPEAKRNNNPSRAWEVLFQKYNIVSQIEQQGYFDIKTSQMMRNSDVRKLWNEKYTNTIPDNRNILKFDFSADLPNVFKAYKLQIMPLGKDTYRIAPFNMYCNLTDEEVPIHPITSPIKISSLDFNKVTTEPNAQTVAEITGMFAYIFNDIDNKNRTVVSTLSGKNNVDSLSFSVNSSLNNMDPINFNIKNWQSEIDGVYEAEESILIIESKMKLPKDFNIRQLFIPRLLIEQIMMTTKIHKDVYAGYFVKTKDVYMFNIYQFTDLHNMNSIKLYKQYKFRLSDNADYIYSPNTADQVAYDLVNVHSVQHLIDAQPLGNHYPRYESGVFVSYPQANNLQLALDYLDMLTHGKNYRTINDEIVPTDSTEAFIDTFKYAGRQHDYYLNLLGYFHLIDHPKDNPQATIVTDTGNRILAMSVEGQSQLLLKLFAQRSSFRITLLKLLKNDTDTKQTVIDEILKETSALPDSNQLGPSTINRRASCVINLCKQLLTLTGVYDGKRTITH